MFDIPAHIHKIKKDEVTGTKKDHQLKNGGLADL
jgi:hypothetical protein